MKLDLILPNSHDLYSENLEQIPSLFRDTDARGIYRFIEFFTANIQNPNTRRAYFEATKQFSEWCGVYSLKLNQVNSVIVAKYIEELTQKLSAPSVKQHLAAIRMLCDFLVTGHVIPINPAHAVRGPKHIVSKGKTPILTAEETKVLINSINTEKLAGLRDRALIAVMVYSFARVGAVAKMNVADYFPKGKRWYFRLHEKGGKYHEMPAHHKAEEYLDAYISAAQITNMGKTPLFRTLDRSREITNNRITQPDVFRMIRRRAKHAGIEGSIGCHTFRGTGITIYLENGGSLEMAQQMAAHSSPRTTKLYDRTRDEVSLDEIERIML